MNTLAGLFSLQTGAWLLILGHMGLAFYLLALNARRRANQAVTVLLLLQGLNGLMLEQMTDARSLAVALWPIRILAAIMPIIPVVMTWVTLVLIKPEWLAGRFRWVAALLVVLCLLPLLLTFVDVGLGGRFWYTEPDPTVYQGGYLSMSQIAQGTLAPFIRLVWLGGMWLIPPALAGYVLQHERTASRLIRHTAWVLLIGQLVLMILEWLPYFWKAGWLSYFVAAGLTALIYGYIFLWQVAVGEVFQRGRLQYRLTGSILAVTIPLLIGLGVLLSNRASAVLEQAALQHLADINQRVSAELNGRLDMNAQSLHQLATLPEMISMDPERQRPALRAMQQVNPDLDFIAVVDPLGTTTVRSDAQTAANYSNRAWFLKARAGVSVVFDLETLSTAGETLPALVIAVPIWQDDIVVGVVMAATKLSEVATIAQLGQVGEQGYIYVVDTYGRAIIHPNPQFSSVLQDLSNELPVARLLDGQQGILPPFSEANQIWLADVETLNNGWGVVVQQPQAEALAAVSSFQAVARLINLAGGILVLFLAVLTVRQALRPIGTLTQAATEVASGDLSHSAPVQSEDELGTLTRVFNRMVSQLRGLIGNLEQQVAERTRAAEFRARQLQAAAEVARDAATARDLDSLLNRAVNLVRSRFGFYHAGIFLMDERGEYAILRAATGEAGRQLLEQGHRLKVGETGIVGYVTKSGQSRIALDVGADATHFRNPALPDTRSELALPLRVGDRIIGALDVQSTVEAAFSEDDVTVLQIMADQLAVAIENIRLVSEAQRAVREVEAVYGRYTRESWAKFAGQTTWGYLYRGLEVESVTAQPPEVRAALLQGQSVQVNAQPGQRSTLAVPIRLRREILGVLNVRFDEDTVPVEAVPLVEELANRLALSMENARLLAESQGRALRERQVSEITARVRAEVEVEALLERALRELGQLLDARQAAVQMEVGE